MMLTYFLSINIYCYCGRTMTVSDFPSEISLREDNNCVPKSKIKVNLTIVEVLKENTRLLLPKYSSNYEAV